jgi:hypothetical protein
MPVGLQVFNTGNNIQIDSTFSNHVLTKAGTILGTSSTFFTTATVTVSGVNPMCFLSADSSTPKAIMTDRKVSGSNFTFHFMVTNGTVRYFIFDLVTPISLHYGFQVFKPDGGLAFDSGGYYLRVEGMRQMVPQGTNSVSTVSIPGKRIACLSNACGQSVFPDELLGAEVTWMEREFGIGFNGGYYVHNDTRGYNEPFTSERFNTAWMLYIDITNYPLTM